MHGHRVAMSDPPPRGTELNLLGAIVNLNHPAHTVDWSFIHLSVANVVVIVLMLVVFVLAVLLPFPEQRAARGPDAAVHRERRPA